MGATKPGLRGDYGNSTDLWKTTVIIIDASGKTLTSAGYLRGLNKVISGSSGTGSHYEREDYIGEYPYSFEDPHSSREEVRQMQTMLKRCGMCGFATFDVHHMFAQLQDWNGATTELCEHCMDALEKRRGMYTLRREIAEPTVKRGKHGAR
jgi:hypothetical protein